MTRFLLATLSSLLLIFALANSASAQGLVEGYPGGYPGDFVASSYSGAVSYNGLPFLGPVDLSVQGAKQGFGYEGAYFSGQTLIPVYSDGRAWYVADIRASVSEEGGMFTNLGMLRRTHFKPLGADFGLGIYWDHDADKFEEFGHSFDQVGVHAHMYTNYLDIEANGYVPVGDTAFFLGAGDTCFVGNNIVFGGIDAALEGFDVTGTVRPPSMIPINGEFTFGGYAYRQDGIDPFGGFLGSFAFQPRPGVTVRTGIQTSDSEIGTVDTAGYIQVVLNLGGSRGYSPTGKDLDPPRRKAHIVRAHSDPEFLIDPDTLAPYIVRHVDNTVAPGTADASVDAPAATINEALALSGTDDIIFVNEGVGAYTEDVTLLTRQLLLGDGVEHLIPRAGGGTFLLCNDVDGVVPTIEGMITTDASNTVRGFTIDAGGSNAIVINNQNLNVRTFIDQVDIVGGTAGIQVTGTNSGDIFITDTSITDTAVGLEIADGNANLDVNFNGTITANAGATAAVEVDQFTGNSVNVTGDIEVNAGATRGIDLTGNGGTVSIAANTTIDGTTDEGIRIQDTVAGGIMEVSNATLTNANAAGDFSVVIEDNAANSSVNLTSLSIENTIDGIRGLSIVNSDNVNLQGNNSIETSEGQLLLVNNSGNTAGGTDVRLNFEELTFNGTDGGNGEDAIVITDSTGRFTVDDEILLTEVDGKGLDIDNAGAAGAFVINVDTFTTVGTGDNAIELTNFQAGSSSVFEEVDINTDTGAGLVATSAIDVTINDGDIDATDGAALDINDTLIDITLDTAQSTTPGAATPGIRVDNSGIVGAGGMNTLDLDSITVDTPQANTDGVFIQDFIGDIVINGGTVSGIDNASGINIDNNNRLADITINDVTVDFAADSDNGIAVSSGNGNIRITNNTVNLNANNGTGYFVEGLGTMNGFDLGNSLNNVTDIVGGDPGNDFQSNMNNNISGTIEVDGVPITP